jgi:hypothetical protein
MPPELGGRPSARRASSPTRRLSATLSIAMHASSGNRRGTAGGDRCGRPAPLPHPEQGHRPELRTDSAWPRRARMVWMLKCQPFPLPFPRTGITRVRRRFASIGAVSKTDMGYQSIRGSNPPLSVQRLNAGQLRPLLMARRSLAVPWRVLAVVAARDEQRPNRRVSDGQMRLSEPG